MPDHTAVAVGAGAHGPGVAAKGYAGGRLAEYLSEEQAAAIDAVAAEVHAAIVSVERLAREGAAERDPFAFLLDLKRSPLIAY